MSGTQRFERRWAWWVRMRQAIAWKAYESRKQSRMRNLAIGFLAAFSAFCACMLYAIAYAQPIPADANRYRLTLTREAQLVWGLSAPIASFAGQIHQESRWNPEARSAVGAQGLGQFMPATATWISGLYPSLKDRAPTNPTWAIRALVTYDANLFVNIKTADDDCQRFAYALSAYNGGLGWVYKRQARSPQPGTCFELTCNINPGITPASQRENADYPRVILKHHQPIYAAWGQGICP
jgi:soluble lytic murein transglycosylase-like protein